MSAYVEHFNHPLQEDFAERDEGLMWVDRAQFNWQLWGYLGWYNREWPHRSLKLCTPYAMLYEACV